MPRRIIIIGGPRVGKTTLSSKLVEEFGISTLHTSQELERLFPANQSHGENWSKSSEYASKWFDEDGDWICEGVQMARALRKWLKANPDKPLDADIFLLRQPFVPQRDGQKSMMKGVETVFREIERELTTRGARVQKLKEPNDAIPILRSAVPINSDEAKAVPVPKFSLKAKVAKDKLNEVAEPFRAAYVEKDDEYVLDPEKLEAIEFDDKAELAGAIENERRESTALRDKYKDVDVDEYRRLKTEAGERDRDNKKKSNDWEGWKQTFEDQKTKELKAKEDEIEALKGRVNTFLLDNKIKQAALEAGVRKKLLDHVVNNTKKFFRLDQNEKIEVLDDSGSPISVSVEAFFKDKYVNDFSEYYEPTSNGGSGATNVARGNGAKPTKTRAEASLLPPMEKMAFMEQVSQGKAALVD